MNKNTFIMKYKAGDFLYKLGDKGINKESQRVFIYTGKTTGSHWI